MTDGGARETVADRLRVVPIRRTIGSHAPITPRRTGWGIASLTVYLRYGLSLLDLKSEPREPIRFTYVSPTSSSRDGRQSPAPDSPSPNRFRGGLLFAYLVPIFCER